jgi:hypothetical protein
LSVVLGKSYFRLLCGEWCLSLSIFSSLDIFMSASPIAGIVAMTTFEGGLEPCLEVVAWAFASGTFFLFQSGYT